MRVTDKNLHELIVNAIEGSTDAFETLYKMNSESILFNVRNLINDSNDSEDVAQEIILQMYKSLSALKSPYAFSAWMHRIIVNTCYRYNERHGGKWTALCLDESEDTTPDTDPDGSPSEAAEKLVQSRRLMRAISKLPEKQRISLIMHYYDEMSFPEIGQSLGVSEKTASANVTKAKKNLKKILRDRNRIYEIDDGSILKSSAIAFALKEEAFREFQSANTEQFWKHCRDSLDGYRAEPAVRDTGNARGGKGFGLTVALTVGLVAAITAGFLILNPPGAQPEAAAPSAASDAATDTNVISQETSLPKAEIVFESEGVNPGNINPKSAFIKIDEPGYTALGWLITDEAEQDVAYGSGDDVNAELAVLAPGGYRLSWSLKNDDGNAASVYRDFTIHS
jgi:RNA polymerase sigma-70 factor (ECF subfamily)